MEGFQSIIRNACLLRPPLSLPGTVLPFFAGQQNTSQQQHEGSAGTDIKESLFENNILTLITAWRVGTLTAEYIKLCIRQATKTYKIT